MNNGSFIQAYEILSRVLNDGAFLNREMVGVSNKKTAKLTYGVMEHYYELSYIVDSLTAKNVKKSIKPILFLGGYAVKYLDYPPNIAIEEINKILDNFGKNALSGFCAAIVMKIYRGEYKEPSKKDKNYEEYKYNLPSFIVGLLKKDYKNEYEEIIKNLYKTRVHVRLREGVKDDVIFSADKNAEKTLTGYFVKNNRQISVLNFEGDLTYMSYCSTLIAESVVRATNKSRLKVIDLCAAPGGKSVYLAEKGYDVLSCDIYDHRLKLISEYAKRMRAKLEIKLNDATVYNPDFGDKFDIVLVDAPCSGFGVLGRRKDSVFNRKYEDILALAELQYNILKNAAGYLKSGGLLVYSTCTVFSIENGKVIDRFLGNFANFRKVGIPLPYENSGEIQFLPDGNGTEGYYLCHMRKN